MHNRIIPITLLLATAVSLLLAQEKSKKQETANVERPPVAAEIADGKRSEFGFISHAIDCPTYFAPHADRPGQKLIETIEVLLPDKMVPGKRYPVVYAIAPLTSRHVKHDRYRLGPLMDVREQDLHNKHKAICIKVMAAHRHMNWRYLVDVVVPRLRIDQALNYFLALMFVALVGLALAFVS